MAPVQEIFVFSSYLTLLPILGFFVRLAKLENLNAVLTIVYACIYWVPYSFLRSAFVLLWHRGNRISFRNANPTFVKPGAYQYDPKADIFRSKYELDHMLQEFGWASYIPWVYHAVICKYNSSLNFKQDFFPYVKRLAERSSDPVFRVLDIGQGPGNSTLDVMRVVGNAEVCCLDIAEKLLVEAKRTVPDANMFKGSMEDTQFLDGSFDVVINVGGINETDVAVSLEETWRVAKDDSLILIADENFDATSYGQKMKCVLISNLTLLESYKYDGSPTRPDKKSVPIIDAFLKKHADQCIVESRRIVKGMFYYYVIQKVSQKKNKAA